MPHQQAIPSLALFLCLVLPPTRAFLAHNIFETGDPRLFPLFCVNSPEQLATLATNTSTQQKIIKDAVKASVGRFLSERHQLPLPPDPQELSLSQLYQMYLGDCASPDRFILAVNELVDNAAKLDILPGLKDDPKFHFDAESIPEAQATLVERQGLLVTTIMTESKFTAARQLLGRSLHSLTTFYAHSNWVELGNTEPLEGLGLPGGELPSLASNSSPACNGSNIVTSGLTSGYLPDQPDSETRCRHGSKEDAPGSGGINKDTGSECWSQHAQHHEEAARQATQAVEGYLDHLRFIIGDNKFGHLFELSQGSALVIAIDRSPSMCDEIEAVKAKVGDIVHTAVETGTNISRYVLVPFDNPPVQDPIVTSDPEEYLKAITPLNCDGGGTEQFWTAVQVGLINAPPFSDIIIFTDEPGDDLERKDSVIGLAESMSSKVSVIYSGGSLIGDHLDLCAATGGLCIQFEKVDSSTIVDLLSSSVEESKATIAQFRDLTGYNLLSLQLDSALVNEAEAWTEVQISGRMQMMHMLSPQYDIDVDLMDDSSMTSSGLQMEVKIRTEDLLFFRFRPSQTGQWLLNLIGSGSEIFSATVTASCTFSFLGTFRYLDLNTNHPNLHKLPGRPVRNSAPTLMVTLTGNYKEYIKPIETLTMSFVDQKGVTIPNESHSTVYSGGEDVIVQTAYESDGGLTNQSFYVRLEGLDPSTGQSFHRLLPTLVTPVSTQVEVTASSALLEANPGNTTSADFLVTDFGEPTEVIINVFDDKGFLMDFNPKTVTLGHNSSESITASFSVPADTGVGTVSTITVTALSSLDQTSNSASVTLTVVTGQTDLQPPVCRLALQDEGAPCMGTPPDECHTEDWKLVAGVQDSNSGLGEVRANSAGTGNLTADFVVGTTDQVEVEYSASCCNSNVSLTLVDIFGNWATGCGTEFTMQNCSIVQVKEVGPSWIFFEWSRPCGVDDSLEVDYAFTMTNLETQDSGFVHHTETCDTWRCHDNFTYASPCTEYRLELNATYMELGEEKEVRYRVRQAFTEEEVSSRPRDFNVTGLDQTSIELQWTEPVSHTSCLSHYRVCWHVVPARRSSNCTTTNTTSLLLSNLSACTLYQVELTAVTSGGFESPPISLEASTLPDHPGAVENLVVTEVGEDYVTVEWDVPTVNSACVLGYACFCYVNNTRLGESNRTIIDDFSTNSCTINGLFPCTDYICEVESMGEDHWQSEPVSVAAHTDSAKLSPPEDFNANYVGSRELFLSWDCPSQGCRCVNQFFITWTDDASGELQELLIHGHTLEADLSGLNPCTSYTVSIQAISEAEVLGDAANLQVITGEVAPGRVTDLNYNGVTEDGFEARWHDPQQDPQCVDSFQTSISDKCDSRWLQSSSIMKRGRGSGEWHYHAETNLTCDTCYGFAVSALSTSGLQGPPATLNVWTQECPP